MVRPWDRLKRAVKGDYGVFRVREDRCRSPVTGVEHDFYVIESNDWVNVIPITPEGRLVLVEQYRQGTEAVSLEIPGGAMDAGDDEPLDTARRELLEETGYRSDEMVYLGVVEPNPAILNNRCYTFLARDARIVGPQALDATEDITVRLADPAEVPGLITSGKITHALVVAAFYLYEQWKRG